jgi:peptide/nickel transport system substrate-binding protein
VPEIDEYVSKIASETDNEERIKLTNEVDKVIWDNVMVLPLYYRANITAVPANLANYGASAFETLPAEDIGYTK